jgi:hypothetical protein
VSTARLAMYKGPARGIKNKLGHWLVCLLTWSKYSHVELEIAGACYSSSLRDGGVRAKVIPDLETSGHWDVFPVEIDVQRALARFTTDRGKHYSWLGMLRVCPLLAWLPRRDATQRFCSDEVAWMCGADDPETFSPEDVLDAYVDSLACADVSTPG